MQDRTYHIKISPEVLKNDIFGVVYAQDEYSRQLPFDICCAISGETVTGITTGITYVYSSMTQILSGGTNGDSILTDLSIPIFLSENTVEKLQEDVLNSLKDKLIKKILSMLFR